MKNTMISILSVLLCLLLLTGCGQEKPAETTAAPHETQAATEAPTTEPTEPEPTDPVAPISEDPEPTEPEPTDPVAPISEDPVPDEPEPASYADVPKTGDVSALWMVLGALSGAGMIFTKKRKDD